MTAGNPFLTSLTSKALENLQRDDPAFLTAWAEGRDRDCLAELALAIRLGQPREAEALMGRAFLMPAVLAL